MVAIRATVPFNLRRLLMTRIVLIPSFWTILAATDLVNAEIHGNESPVSLGLLISGVVGTAALIWFTRGERDKIMNKLDRIESVLMSRPCILNKASDECKERGV